MPTLQPLPIISPPFLIFHQRWNKVWKTGKAKNFGIEAPEKKNLQLPHYSSLSPLIGGTCPFCPPVGAMHAVTITSLKDAGLQLSVDTVLTSKQIRFVSFHRISVGSDHREWSHWKVGGQSSILALASKSRGAFALTALQLVPPAFHASNFGPLSFNGRHWLLMLKRRSGFYVALLNSPLFTTLLPIFCDLLFLFIVGL